MSSNNPVSLVIKNADGSSVGTVKSLTDSDIATLNDYLTNATNLYASIEQLKNDVATTNKRISVSSNKPTSSGNEGDIWFVYE